MKNKALVELLKYSSPLSIWVVAHNNKLLELKCPFRVKCIRPVGYVVENRLYKVTYIKLSTDLKVVFIINEQPYYYSYFEILLR